MLSFHKQATYGHVELLEALHAQELTERLQNGGLLTELLWCHGARDSVVEPTLAAQQAKMLKERPRNGRFCMLLPPFRSKKRSKRRWKSRRGGWRPFALSAPPRAAAA